MYRPFTSITLILSLFAAGALAQDMAEVTQTSESERDWQLTFYEHQNILSDHVYLGYFETLLDCERTGRQLKARLPDSTFGCSFGCRISDSDTLRDMGVLVCEKVYREWEGMIYD